MSRSRILVGGFLDPSPLKWNCDTRSGREGADRLSGNNQTGLTSHQKPISLCDRFAHRVVPLEVAQGPENDMRRLHEIDEHVLQTGSSSPFVCGRSVQIP
jgi:hypothetical protein